MDFASNLNATRVLVAENDPDKMDRIADILEEAGYNIQKAYYAGDALFALSQGQHDLVLIDVAMRDRDQSLLYAQMVRFKSVRWIALVDKGNADPQQFLHQGASAYILCPFQSSMLLSHVENVTKGQKMTPRPLARLVDHAVDDFSAALERRLIEQQTLSTLTRSLSAVLDLDTLLTQVVDSAVRLSNAEEGLLLLPDEEGKALYIRAVKGIDSETARNFRIKTEDTLAGKVLHTGQPVLVGDQGLQKVKTEYLVKSLLYVPLSIKGQTIGVLGVNNKHADRTFNTHDSELLQDLAAHAAVAIENARLYEESVLRTRELSTLVQASQAANSTLAIEQVLSIIADQLIGALDVAQCYISERPPGSAQLNTLAVSHRTLWNPTEGPSLTYKGSSAIEQAFQHKRMVFGTPARPDPEPSFTAALPHRYHAQRVAYIPLFTQDTPLGLVKLSFITLVPEQASLQKNYLQMQQIALEMVVTLAGADARTHRKTLFRSAQRILEASGADWCEIALWNPARHHFNAALSFGEAIWRENPKPSLPLDQFPKLAGILEAPDTLSGVPEDDLRYLAENEHVKSVLGVPLVIKGQAAGLVLLADTLQDRRFSRREVELAQALIVQAANALSNARLFRDLEISLEELHRAQSKLVQTARLTAMGELAAAVAHQINNPLTTILGDTELILRDLPPEDENYEALEAVSRAGKRAHEVVRRLLAMARQQTADDPLESLDINQTIQNTLMLVKSHIQQGSVTLSVLLEDNLPPVTGIQGQLEDVWLNLLMNARDAVTGREAPRIGIATKAHPDKSHVEVLVWDNGIGIPQDQQRQIFEPFFTTKPSGEGTGLGLHICQQIVEKCRGSISVQSTYNEGTCFTIRLPVDTRRVVL